MPSSSARCSQLPRAEDKLPFYIGLRKLRDFVNGTLHSLNEAEITFPDIKIKDTDDVLQKTVIRISNKPFSELSAETLKPYGDKIPSGQMISKHISSPSSPNLIFNTDALTTQTMSILHNTNHQQNGNLLTYDQQTQRVSLQNNGNYTPSTNHQPQRLSTKNTYIDNSSSNTNAAVLAALASGGYNSSSQSQQTYYQHAQTVYIGGQQSSLNNNSTSKLFRINFKKANRFLFLVLNSRSSTPTSSYVIHHPPQSTSIDHQNSSSQLVSRQLLNEPLPSFDTILNSSFLPTRTQQIPSKDSISSHQSPSKQTLITAPSTIKSTLILPKSSNSIEKRPINPTDECLYVRYEREPCSITSDQFRFSYVIDEHPPSLHKRLRYVSINDL
jgi:hypothetical protein